MSKVLFLFVLLAGVLSLYAEDPIKMTAKDESGKSSFTTWNVNGGGTDAPSLQHDYLDEKFVLRTPNTGSSFSFNGKSLQLGTAKSTDQAVLALCRNANATVDFANNGVKLVNGRFQPYVAARQYTFTGIYDVQAAPTLPFEFWIADTASHLAMTNVFTGTFTGTGSLTILNYVSNPNGYAILCPADAADFSGTLRIGGVGDHDYPVRLELQGSKTFGGTIQVGSGSSLLPQWGSTKWTIGALSLESGSTFLSKLANPTTSTMTLTEGLETAYPVYVDTPYKLDLARDPATFQVLTLPVEKGTIHPEHFVVKKQTTSFPDSLPWVGFTVTTNNAIASLNLVQRPIVYIATKDGGNPTSGTGFDTEFTNTVAFSDRRLTHADADYVCDREHNGWRLLAPPEDLLDEGLTWRFTGASLTIGTNVNFRSVAFTNDIPCLRLMAGSQFWPRAALGSRDAVVKGGTIHIGAMAGFHCVDLYVYRNAKTIIESELVGNGRLTVRANSGSSVPSGTAILRGLNTGFVGKISVEANDTANTDPGKAITLLLEDGRNLGGELVSFAKDALELKHASTLAAERDVDFSTPNRGLYVNGPSRISVAAGATLTVGNTITFNGTLTKIGVGRLLLNGSAAVESAATLAVGEGTIQAGNANALVGVDLSFANGTALIVDTTKDFGEKGVDLSGATTAVNVQLGFAADETEHELSAYPLCTVPEGVTVTVARPKRHFVKLTTKSNGDGTVTYLADVGVTGAAIILR